MDNHHFSTTIERIRSPWGEFKWVLQRIPERKWLLISTISSEERCTAIPELLTDSHRRSEQKFIEVIDEYGDDEHKNSRDSHLKRLGTPEKQTFRLLEPIERFINFINEISHEYENIILDISCMPKRFFFPSLKLLYNAPNVKNLSVGYTVPQKYSEKELAFNPLELDVIPLFRNMLITEEELAIIGVGFLPLGLGDLILKMKMIRSTFMLMNVTPGIGGFQRNWQFLSKFYDQREPDSKDIRRINGFDVPHVFSLISSLSAGREKRTMMLPFGPKPISLAMCLFSIIHGCGAYYMQPQQYSSEYSSGIGTSYLYVIKHEGSQLYS